MHECLALKSRDLRLGRGSIKASWESQRSRIDFLEKRRRRRTDSPHIMALKLYPLWPQQLVAQLWLCRPHFIYVLSVYNLKATMMSRLHLIISQTVQSQMHHGVSKCLLGWRCFLDGRLALTHWLSNYSTSAQFSIFWLVVQHLIPLQSDDHPTSRKNSPCSVNLPHAR